MTFGPLLDLRPDMDSREFRALLLLLIGWRQEHDLDQQRLDEAIRRFRLHPNLHVLGLKRGVDPLGLIAIEIESPQASVIHHSVIHHIVVRPDWRRQGLGRALIRQAADRVDFAHRVRFFSAWIGVRSKNGYPSVLLPSGDRVGFPFVFPRSSVFRRELD